MKGHQYLLNRPLINVFKRRRTQWAMNKEVEQTISEDVAEATTAHNSGTPALEQ